MVFKRLPEPFDEGNSLKMIHFGTTFSYLNYQPKTQFGHRTLVEEEQLSAAVLDIYVPPQKEDPQVAHKKFRSLSGAERDVIKAVLCTSGDDKSISKKLDISPNTVKVHLKSIYNKLQLEAGNDRRVKMIYWLGIHGFLQVHPDKPLHQSVTLVD